MEISLEKVDILRERAGIGYQEAVNYLAGADGDVVQALVAVEQAGEPSGRAEPSGELCPESARVMRDARETAAGVLERVKGLVESGNRTKVRLRHGRDTVAELPVTAVVIGTLLAPQVAAIGAVVALAGGCSVEVSSRGCAASDEEGGGGQQQGCSPESRRHEGGPAQGLAGMAPPGANGEPNPA